MSGIIFDTPAARFLRRSSLMAKVTRVFASLLDPWPTNAGGRLSRLHSRRHEAEFPAAQIASQLRILRDAPAADRASNDALRPHNNSVNIEDQHEISFIRERLAAFARRRPTEGRQSLPVSPPGRQSAGQEIGLAKDHGIFFERRAFDERHRSGASPQWHTPAAACAQA